MEFGEWALLVGMPAWRIESDNEVLLASEDPRELISRQISVLNSITVSRISPISPGGEVSFDFGEIRLHLFPLYSGNFYDSTERGEVSDDYEHWNLLMPSGRTVVGGPGALVSVKEESRLRKVFRR
ncbi:hypothetical protein F0L68_36035 [Solihabitans fulvus]|uniref:Uncharacterized protein n=1 Tax=Solihabitans fulvus TaxID=1892852 RepID=A0A5B2WP20_9PSEU|nr:hypothetical protein [Solihabitans fulvus]KAA2252452.1 hypothetical protein F0L68_36035 [Solihabitans fulvus]